MDESPSSYALFMEENILKDSALYDIRFFT